MKPNINLHFIRNDSELTSEDESSGERDIKYPLVVGMEDKLIKKKEQEAQKVKMPHPILKTANKLTKKMRIAAAATTANNKTANNNTINTARNTKTTATTTRNREEGGSEQEQKTNTPTNSTITSLTGSSTESTESTGSPTSIKGPTTKKPTTKKKKKKEGTHGHKPLGVVYDSQRIERYKEKHREHHPEKIGKTIHAKIEDPMYCYEEAEKALNSSKLLGLVKVSNPKKALKLYKRAYEGFIKAGKYQRAFQIMNCNIVKIMREQKTITDEYRLELAYMTMEFTEHLEEYPNMGNDEREEVGILKFWCENDYEEVHRLGEYNALDAARLLNSILTFNRSELDKVEYALRNKFNFTLHQCYRSSSQYERMLNTIIVEMKKCAMYYIEVKQGMVARRMVMDMVENLLMARMHDYELAFVALCKLYQQEVKCPGSQHRVREILACAMAVSFERAKAKEKQHGTNQRQFLYSVLDDLCVIDKRFDTRYYALFKYMIDFPCVFQHSIGKNHVSPHRRISPLPKQGTEPVTIQTPLTSGSRKKLESSIFDRATAKKVQFESMVVNEHATEWTLIELLRTRSIEPIEDIASLYIEEIQFMIGKVHSLMDILCIASAQMHQESLTSSDSSQTEDGAPTPLTVAPAKRSLNFPNCIQSLPPWCRRILEIRFHPIIEYIESQSLSRSNSPQSETDTSPEVSITIPSF